MSSNIEKFMYETVEKTLRTILKSEIEKTVNEFRDKISNEADMMISRIAKVYQIQHDRVGVRIAITNELNGTNKSIQELEKELEEKNNEIKELKNKLALYKPME